ncbi:ATP-binding protein [Streptomyces sp. NPDC021224]|uniref:ATP-binding protein n=1 Tax=unclassified Streptomyces TaxID=2593676 RepID=UPI00379588BA
MPEIPVVPALWRFPAHPASVPRARCALTGWLPKDVPGGVRADLALLASELVTNAVRYGAAADEFVELVAWPADGYYWVAVSDAGDGRPVVRRPPDVERESGRGLVLVDALAAAWGVRPRPYRGKSVVAGLALP